MGYKFQNYNLELRYQPDKKYKTASVICGYSFLLVYHLKEERLYSAYLFFVFSGIANTPGLESL